MELLGSARALNTIQSNRKHSKPPPPETSIAYVETPIAVPPFSPHAQVLGRNESRRLLQQQLPCPAFSDFSVRSASSDLPTTAVPSDAGEPR